MKRLISQGRCAEICPHIPRSRQGWERAETKRIKSTNTTPIKCRGSLSDFSKTSGLRVPIDSWYEEVHVLTLEGGIWRIRGNAGEMPRVLPFGTAPHPLF